MSKSKWMINIDDEQHELVPFSTNEITVNKIPEEMEKMQMTLTTVDGEIETYDVYLSKQDFDKILLNGRKGNE